MGARRGTKLVKRGTAEPPDGLLLSRRREALTELEKLHVSGKLYMRLLPHVRWTRGEAAVDPPPRVVQELESAFGERFLPLDEVPEEPSEEAFAIEVARQRRKGVPLEIASATASIEFLRRSMRGQMREPLTEREAPIWEAACAAAVAEAAIEDGSAEALACADEYFDRLDAAKLVSPRLADRRRQVADAATRELRKRGKQRSSKGGKVDKRRRGVVAAIHQILRDEPRLKSIEVWGRIPSLDEDFHSIVVDDVRVHRLEIEGVEQIEQVVERAGHERIDRLSQSSFYRYVAVIRKEKLRTK